MNGQPDYHTGNHFRKVKRQNGFRRSGSNFDTFGNRYQSNTLKAISKGNKTVATLPQIKTKEYKNRNISIKNMMSFMYVNI